MYIVCGFVLGGGEFFYRYGIFCVNFLDVKIYFKYSFINFFKIKFVYFKIFKYVCVVNVKVCIFFLKYLLVCINYKLFM